MLAQSKTAAKSGPRDDRAADTAWAPYQPDDQRPWNVQRAGHLLRRAGFGATARMLRQALADGPEKTIDNLLRPDADADAFNQTYDRYEESATGSNSADELRAWWLRRMIHTPQPLLERMTLFWHSHFGISNAGVKNGRLMHDHVCLLRRHALGRFDAMLRAVTRDPAVYVALEAAANRKAMPNENLARALLEDYCVGPGGFTGRDVQEAARALTGRFVLRGEFREIPREHDGDVKELLGRRGRFDGDGLVEVLVEHSTTPRWIVGKLYRWLISEVDEPDEQLLAPLAASFAKDYDIGKLVAKMLRSNLFFSPAEYRRRVKSPVEFAVGIVRAMEADVPTARLAADVAGLGQNLYHPPTEKGWTGGPDWINDATLLGRRNLAAALFSTSGPYGGRLDPFAVAKANGSGDVESAARLLADLFLDGNVARDLTSRLLKTGGTDPAARMRRLAFELVTLPEFHLS